MVKKITEHLTEHPSYLMKGDEWLAEYFGCGETTIRKIKAKLRTVKRAYIASLG